MHVKYDISSADILTLALNRFEPLSNVISVVHDHSSTPVRQVLVLINTEAQSNLAIKNVKLYHVYMGHFNALILRFKIK